MSFPMCLSVPPSLGPCWPWGEEAEKGLGPPRPLFSLLPSLGGPANRKASGEHRARLLRGGWAHVGRGGGAGEGTETGLRQTVRGPRLWGVGGSALSVQPRFW